MREEVRSEEGGGWGKEGVRRGEQLGRREVKRWEEGGEEIRGVKRGGLKRAVDTKRGTKVLP